MKIPVVVLPITSSKIVKANTGHIESSVEKESTEVDFLIPLTQVIHKEWCYILRLTFC